MGENQEKKTAWGQLDDEENDYLHEFCNDFGFSEEQIDEIDKLSLPTLRAIAQRLVLCGRRAAMVDEIFSEVHMLKEKIAAEAEHVAIGLSDAGAVSLDPL